MILLIGPPGAGKSVQGRLLQERGEATWFSAGQLLRDFANDDEQKTMMKGELVTDEELSRVLSKAVKQANPELPVVLDGIPRRTSQIDWLVSDANPRNVKGVVVLNIPFDVARNRLRLRGRKDDDGDRLRKRYDIYANGIEAVLDKFTSLNVPVIKIDGSAGIEEVYKKVLQAFNEEQNDDAN